MAMDVGTLGAMKPSHRSPITVHSLLVAVAGSLVAGGCAAKPPPAEATTMRALYGIRAPARLDAGSTALVLVDFQEEFFHGRLHVDAPEAAAREAASLREWARARGILVVHVRNVVERDDSPVFAQGSPTIAFVPQLEPREGEMVVTKHQAGGFSKSDLDARLRERGIKTIVVGGIMTHLAVDTTARDGAVLGYSVIVAADACTTRDLPSPLGGAPIPGAEVHQIALASLADRFAAVMTVADIKGLAVAQ